MLWRWLHLSSASRRGTEKLRYCWKVVFSLANIQMSITGQTILFQYLPQNIRNQTINQMEYMCQSMINSCSYQVCAYSALYALHRSPRSRNSKVYRVLDRAAGSPGVLGHLLGSLPFFWGFPSILFYIERQLTAWRHFRLISEQAAAFPVDKLTYDVLYIRDHHNKYRLIIKFSFKFFREQSISRTLCLTIVLEQNLQR